MKHLSYVGTRIAKAHLRPSSSLVETSQRLDPSQISCRQRHSRPSRLVPDLLLLSTNTAKLSQYIGSLQLESRTLVVSSVAWSDQAASKSKF